MKNFLFTSFGFCFCVKPSFGWDLISQAALSVTDGFQCDDRPGESAAAH